MQTLSRYLVIAILGSGFFLPSLAIAASFDPNVLGSVVSLLPNWPERKTGNRTSTRPPRDPEGTAVAIFDGGYFATNAHVLGPAKTADIRLNDGRLLPAEIVGRDRATDLALLKVAVDFPLLPVSYNPQIGAPVCAVGNQFGMGLSVTCGVVSALHRTGTGFNPIEDFIQTDAVINPGGSGGALVDENGHLVGLVSAIFTNEQDANTGINFATSAALLVRVMEDLRDFGKVMRVKSGLQVRSLNQDQKRSFSGARIIHVKPGSAADRAGLRVDDILTRIGSRFIRKPTDVASALQFLRPGSEAEIEFIRNTKSMQARLKP